MIGGPSLRDENGVVLCFRSLTALTFFPCFLVVTKCPIVHNSAANPIFIPFLSSNTHYLENLIERTNRSYSGKTSLIVLLL